MNDRLPIRDRTLILRILVPGLEARLRDKMKETEEEYIAQQQQEKGQGGSSAGGQSASKSPSAGGGRTPGESSSSSSARERILDLEGVTCEPTTARNRTLWNFHCDGATYPAKLVNLPCPVELHKTHDHAAYYKCADVAQMLIVYEDDIALTEADEKPVDGYPSYYHSGLTPPMKRVVERRFAAREQKAQAPPRAQVTDVEGELLQLMENLAKDEKTKRNKVPTLTSANKVLEDVVEEIVDYEPWMDDYGRQPTGVEFDTDDQMCHAHPEVWLSQEDIKQIKEEELEAIRKKEAAAEKKEAKKREKKKQAEDAKATSQPKKGIASQKNMEPVDEVTQMATMMMTGAMGGEDAELDLLNDDMFEDLDLDENLNLDDLGL